MSREAGKGVKPHPMFISKDKFDENWDRIFGKKKDICLHLNTKQVYCCGEWNWECLKCGEYVEKRLDKP